MVNSCPNKIAMGFRDWSHCPQGYESFATFLPTFLYESIWCVLVAILLMKLERTFKPGQSFLFYIAAYCVGRFFIESLRIDTAHAFLGLRVNEWVSLAIVLWATLQFRRTGRGASSAPSDESGTL